MSKNNRKRPTGWAWTKKYPHERHPATYRRKDGDEIEYITFTHSDEVDFGGKGKVRTVPMLDNISPSERKKNKDEGKKFGEIVLMLTQKFLKGNVRLLERRQINLNPWISTKSVSEKCLRCSRGKMFPPRTGADNIGRERKRPKRKNKHKKKKVPRAIKPLCVGATRTRAGIPLTPSQTLSMLIIRNFRAKVKQFFGEKQENPLFFCTVGAFTTYGKAADRRRTLWKQKGIRN